MSPGTLATAAALLMVPGMAVGFALFGPGRVGLPARIGLTVPLGYAMVGVTSLLLALAGLLYTPLLILALLAVTSAALVAGLRRHGLREHWAAWRTEVREDRWPLAVAAVVLVALAVPRFSYSPVLNLADQTPLRYWADGVEIADANHIPSTSLQWGTLAPSAQSKVVLNAFNAAAVQVLGRGPFEPMGALLVVLSIGLLLLAYALARELGLRFAAPLVPVLLFGNDLIGPRNLTADLQNMKAENWGRLVVLAAVLLGVRALRGRRSRNRRREALLAGALLGVGVGTHLVATVVGVGFLVCYVAGWWAVRGRIRQVGTSLATILLVGGAIGAAVLAAPPGDVGFEGAGDQGAYAQLAAELGLPGSFDPTRYLALGEIEQPPIREGFYDPPGEVYHEYVRRAVGEPVLRRPVRWLFPVGMALGAAALFLWGEAKLRAMAVAALGVALAVLVVGLAFNYLFEVYVMAEFGPRRLFDYTGVAVVLVAAGVVEVAMVRLSSRPSGASLVHVAMAVAVLALTAAAVPRTISPSAQEAFFETAIEPVTFIQANIPCAGRVLADRRTLASFEILARHAGVLEGMGPYLRPALLGTAVGTMLGAEAFFADPAANVSYLTEQGVGAVVVTAYEQNLGGVGGPLKVSPVNLDALDAAPFLQVAARSETVTVYRVVGLITVRSFPDVETLPGYFCPAV